MNEMHYAKYHSNLNCLALDIAQNLSKNSQKLYRKIWKM